MGKRSVAEMSSFDLLAILILGTTITEPIVTKRLGIASYYSVSIALIYLVLTELVQRTRLKKVLTFDPTVLIKNGDIDEKGVKKAKLTINELLGELRVKGYTRVQDVELATMEESGDISVIAKADYRPLQPSDLNLAVKQAFIPIPLIIEGQILQPNIQYLNKTEEWLMNKLASKQIKKDDLSKITLATLNQKGSVDVDFESQKGPEPDNF
ncbi:DUF421 domain-containing protein [Paenibacillus hexagrammi]|uniref:DUF421 domain-containing protein n=1 Tax=Paenibacillus hexagrammi TaxID=2908839 RepID=A0ABY3SHK9_9BACL|nr:DUF421 domain-containing protein [Paenibacillus sp. YPD9-1]UJF32865.1 DUF421 domain-containing protein [Paenibacillus sp. YPD9-1]